MSIDEKRPVAITPLMNNPKQSYTRQELLSYYNPLQPLPQGTQLPDYTATLAEGSIKFKVK